MKFVLGAAAARDIEDEIQEALVYGRAVSPDREKRARVEVDPARLSTREVLVRRDLERGGGASEGGSAPGREENERRAGRHQGGGRDLVVSGRLEQREPRTARSRSVADHVGDGRIAALLDAAERFLFEGGDAPVLVAGGGVLVNRLAV